MTMLETIDLMVAVTSQVTKERPQLEETDDEINQLWMQIFDRLYLKVNKKPAAATQFFHYFLLSQGKTQQGGGGRYSKASSFKGIEEHYLKQNYDTLTGWSKANMLQFYTEMNQLSIHFLDAYSPHSKPENGVFQEGGDEHRKLERNLLRMIQHSGFTQHIPMYMAACQIFEDSRDKNRFISEVLRKWVHYFLRSSSIPSGKGLEGIGPGKTYGLVFKWCKLLQNRNLLPSVIQQKDEQIKRLDSEIIERKKDLKDADSEAEKEQIQQLILNLEAEKTTVKNTPS